MAADHAHPEVHPPPPGAQALFAAVRGGLDLLHLGQMVAELLGIGHGASSRRPAGVALSVPVGPACPARIAPNAASVGVASSPNTRVNAEESRTNGRSNCCLLYTSPS